MEPYSPVAAYAETNPVFRALYGSAAFQDAPASSTFYVPGYGTYQKNSGGGLGWLHGDSSPAVTLDLNLIHQPAQLGRLAPLVDVATQRVRGGVGYVGADGSHPLGGVASFSGGSGSGRGVGAGLVVAGAVVVAGIVAAVWSRGRGK